MIEEKRNLRITCDKCGVLEEYTVYTEVPDYYGDSDTAEAAIYLLARSIPTGWKRVSSRNYTKDRHYCNNCNN